MTNAKSNNPIPLVDLEAQYLSIKSEIDAAIASVIERSAYVGGIFAEHFEKEFAATLKVGHCVGVGNGTDALFIALKALGIGSGDEVIVPANTFIATGEAVTATGARVVFADCDPDSYNIAPKEIVRRITAKTKAIIPVHLYGQPADLDEIMAIARERNLFVVEDAAQAHLAVYKGKNIGSIGTLACFSFYPGKNLGAYGDAGAIVTNDEALAKKCRMLANHGRIDKYDHQVEGYNSRLDGLQAAVLSVKLKHLAEWTKMRRAIARKYNELLKNSPTLVLPKEMPERESVYHLYVVRAKDRELLRGYLKKSGVETGVHYPIGLPYLKAYKYLELDKPSDYPVTNRLQGEILSLPIYPELTDEQLAHIAANIKAFYSAGW